MAMTLTDAANRINDDFQREHGKNLKTFDLSWLLLLAQLIPTILNACEERNPEKLNRFARTRKHVAAKQVKNLIREQNGGLIKCDDELATTIVRLAGQAKVEELRDLRRASLVGGEQPDNTDQPESGEPDA